MNDGAGEGGTLTRADLARKVYACAQLSRQEAAQITDTVIETLVNALVAGENVKINNFATFVVHQKNARPGRNPKTLQNALVPARSVVLFRASNALRDAINPTAVKLVDRRRRRNGAATPVQQPDTTG